MERSAEFLRGCLHAIDDLSEFPEHMRLEWINRRIEIYTAELADAEAREAFPIPDTLPAVPENREALESDSIKLAKLIDGMFYCEGGGYDSDDVREGIQKAFEIGVQSARKTEANRE